MTILITAQGEYLAQGDAPEVGKYYTLELAEEGTERQNKAFHSLIQEYWASGASSRNAASFLDFRGQIKLELGAGFESYIYATMKGMQTAKKREDIPDYVEERHIYGVLKSWSKYSKKERRETMDRLISEMIQVGVNSKKFYEILDGLTKHNVCV